MENDSRADAIDFLNQENIGVLATISPDGHPRARFMYYAADDQFNVYLLTYKNTRKVADLEGHYLAAFTVANELVPKSIQIEGTVADVTDEPTSDGIIKKLFERMHSNQEFGAPLTHFDSSGLRFYKLSPTWVRFGDFTEGQKTDDVLKEIVP